MDKQYETLVKKSYNSNMKPWLRSHTIPRGFGRLLIYYFIFHQPDIQLDGILVLCYLLYSARDANAILNTPISYNNLPDKFIWIKSASGDYLVQKGFSLITSNNVGSHQDAFWKFLLSISLPMKDILLIWKIINSAIPSVDKLLPGISLPRSSLKV
ncbi:hypothetical protein K1719_023719 [Acacia pycnantha]|nr:hypothetical protein K1719_023719 [Acacia pycnantha]